MDHKTKTESEILVQFLSSFVKSIDENQFWCTVDKNNMFEFINFK